MPEPLPKFRFHPGPFASGALVDSVEACECCGRPRGCLYDGPVFSQATVERVCPWCIADGSADAKWGVCFTDGDFRDAHGDDIELPRELWQEVFCRTPGVVGALQPISWWVHCELPAAFLGVMDDRVRFHCVVCGKKRSYHDLD